MPATVAMDNVVVKVSRDRLTASLSWIGKTGDSAPSLKDVITQLEEAEVSLEGNVRSRAEEFIARVQASVELVQEHEEGLGEFVVAEGAPAIHGRDERIAWTEKLTQHSAEWRGDSQVDIYPVHRIVHMAAGTLLGVIEPLVVPRNGMDLLGQRIEATGTSGKLTLGAGLAVTSEEPAQVQCSVAGRIVFAEGMASVEPAKVINRDLAGARGNVSCDKHLFVNGAIADRVTVDGAKSLTVSSTIDAAHIQVGGDLTVRGGIVGQGSGRVRAGGEVAVRYCNDANIIAGGDVKISKQIMSSCIGAGSRLLAPDAVMVGGCLFARDGAELAVVGSDADVATVVYLGVRADCLAEAMELQAKIDAKNRKIDDVRGSIQPLMKRLKSLSHEQRQRATELLATVDGITCQADEQEAHRAELMQSAMAADEPELVVHRQIFPGVTVRLGDRETVIQKTLIGPMTIRREKIDKVTQIVVIEEQTGSIRTLNSQHIPPDELTAALYKEVLRYFDDQGDTAD